jgi:hypothetical protein
MSKNSLVVIGHEQPINRENALATLASDQDYSLWLCEVGLFDLDEDPGTPYETFEVLFSTDDKELAGLSAEAVARNVIPTEGNASFKVLDISEASPEDYQA